MTLIETIFREASRLDIDAVLIGGLALPAYSVIRTTLDIDIAISIESQDKLDEFIERMKRNEVKTKQNPKLNHDLFIVFGKGTEAEIWLKPCDSFTWDQEMKKHITKFRGLIRVLSLEDYIMTKLARTDRTSTDINDILQLLIANRDFINWEYLHFRLDWLNIRKDFEDLIEIFNSEIEPNFKDKAKEILTIYYRSKKKI